MKHPAGKTQCGAATAARNKKKKKNAAAQLLFCSFTIPHPPKPKMSLQKVA
jgi:hypothetical protein